VKQADGTVRPTASFLLTPAPPSTFRSAVDKVPLLRRLQRGRYKAGEDFVPARPISAAPPEVPTTLDNQSTAVVVAEIGESGEVRKAQRRKGDETLGAIAAEAVRNWRFEPATLAGEPVSSEVIVRFTVNSARLQQARND
jgi:TonB family protein